MKNHQEIKINTKRGFVLSCIEGDTITRSIQKNGEYDTNTLESMVAILKKINPHVSLDIGANIGNHAVVVSQYSQKLIAFEPVEFIYNLLESNLKQNNLINSIAINKGLSNECLKRDIFVPAFNLGCSSLEVEIGEGESSEIELVVGDDWLKNNCKGEAIDFIKMDIEGHEVSALIGMTNTILTNQPLLLLEWRNKNTVDLFKELDLYNKIFSGYSFFSLSNTSYKKAHSNNFMGKLKRFYCRFFNKKWCLSEFRPNQSYSNVYLIPSRYLAKVNEFIY